MATRGAQILVARLGQVNRTTVFLAVLVLMLAGLLLPSPYGAVLLLLLAAGLATVLTVTWGHGTPRGRALRLVILTIMVAFAVSRLVGAR